MAQNPTHRNDIDALKGISIIAVVLYHMNLLNTGYLGVDVFFAINGFFILPRMLRIDTWSDYFSFMKKRIFRLLPLILIATFVCLAIGYWGMLPDDYESVCQSIIATNIFSNNILQNFTINNYWDVWNDYKPLMHTWYIGVLFEFYLVMPLLIMLLKKVTGTSSNSSSKTANSMTVMLISLAVLSFILYLLPVFKDGTRFYMLPFRIYEFLAGGFVALFCISDNSRSKGSKIQGFILLFILLLILFSGLLPINSKEKIFKTAILPVTVLVTTMLLTKDYSKQPWTKSILNFSILRQLGKMSFSIFIWHQIILAFYRYYYTKELTVTFVVLFLLFTFLLSWVTYQFIEQKVKLSKMTVSICLTSLVLITLCSFYIYRNSGVVRDVPELDIKLGDDYKGKFKQFNDRIYDYDKDFTPTNKIKVFILGNSFARDWANMLLSSNYKDSISLSYVHDNNEDVHSKVIRRSKEADVIFVHVGEKSRFDKEIESNKRPGVKVWGIGNKNYGESNGSIYSKRFSPDYLRQTVKLADRYKMENEKFKKDWGDYYIDIISYSKADDGNIRIFTPNGKFISMDTRHWTEEGAKYYATLIDLSKYFSGIPRDSEQEPMINK